MTPFAQVSVSVIGCGSYYYFSEKQADPTKLELKCASGSNTEPQQVSSYRIRITVDYAEYDKLKTSKLSLVLINEDDKYVAIDGIKYGNDNNLTCNATEYTLNKETNTMESTSPNVDTKIEVILPGEEVEGEIILSMQQEYKPTECANHGLCNTETGLCECFQQYYGAACEKQRSIQF